MKQIRDQTGVKIDIPRRDSLEPDAVGNGHANGASPPPRTPLEEGEEVMIPVSVQGPSFSVEEAKAHILAIVAAKMSKTSQRIRDIPIHMIRFVLSRKKFYEAAAAPEEELRLSYKGLDRDILIEGDRNAVNGAAERIKLVLENLAKNLTSATVQLPKRQHRLLIGDGSQEIFATSRCAIVVPDIDDDGEEIRIWGFPNDLSSGLQAVMQVSSSRAFDCCIVITNR